MPLLLRPAEPCALCAERRAPARSCRSSRAACASSTCRSTRPRTAWRARSTSPGRCARASRRSSPGCSPRRTADPLRRRDQPPGRPPTSDVLLLGRRDGRQRRGAGGRLHVPSRALPARGDDEPRRGRARLRSPTASVSTSRCRRSTRASARRSSGAVRPPRRPGELFGRVGRGGGGAGRAVAPASSALPDVRVPERLYEAIARLVPESGVVSHRADVTILECAKGLAALAGRGEVDREDVFVAARLGLGHRIEQDSFGPGDGIDDRLLRACSTTSSRSGRRQKKRRARRRRGRHAGGAPRGGSRDPRGRGGRRRGARPAAAGRPRARRNGRRDRSLVSLRRGKYSRHRLLGAGPVDVAVDAATPESRCRPCRPQRRGWRSRRRTCAERCASTAFPTRSASWSTTATRFRPTGSSSRSRARLRPARGRHRPRRPRRARRLQERGGRGDRRAASHRQPRPRRPRARRRPRLRSHATCGRAGRRPTRAPPGAGEAPNARPVAVVVSDGLPNVPRSPRGDALGDALREARALRRAHVGVVVVDAESPGRSVRGAAPGSSRRPPGGVYLELAELSPGVFAEALDRVV